MASHYFVREEITLVVKPLSIPAAAELLSISPWTIRKYITQGKLHPVRIGRRVLLEESELQRFIAANKTGEGSVQS